MRHRLAKLIFFIILFCFPLLVLAEEKDNSNSLVPEEANEQSTEIQEKDVVIFGETEWIVLSVEDDKILLISKYCQAKGNFSEKNDSTCSWEKSPIRAWLNDYFYENTFSEDEQTDILDTYVINMRGEDTSDKLYLLDEGELNKYLPVQEERTAGYTDEENVWWWLRSPGGDKDKVACVNDNGAVLKIAKAYNPNGIQQAVRPVMWVSKKADIKPIEMTIADEIEEPSLYTKEEFLNILSDESFTENDLLSLKADLPNKLTGEKIKEIIVGKWKSGSFNNDGKFVFSDRTDEFHEDGTASFFDHNDYEWIIKDDKLVLNDTLEIEFRKVADDCYWCYYVNENLVAVYIKEEASPESDEINNTYSDSEIIHKVQTVLNEKGYDCGTPDGDKGPKTTSAIQAYQTDNGLEATGEIDDALLSSLGIQ